MPASEKQSIHTTQPTGGLEIKRFPQTYMRYSPVAKSAEVFVNRKIIRHNGNPVLAWAMSNVVMETDVNANIKPNKKKSANKIDPAIAFLMSFGTWQAEHEEFAFSLNEEQKRWLADFDGI
ncbi:terminase [Xenorhabdus sp. TS4]|nr:terminase [Xenorhabdus sp. TS4]